MSVLFKYMKVVGLNLQSHFILIHDQILIQSNLMYKMLSMWWQLMTSFETWNYPKLLHFLTPNATESGKAGLIAHDSRLIFHQKYKATWINYHIIPGLAHQNQLDLIMSSLLLLAAFPKHRGNPYMQSGALMELLSAWGWLYVTVQLHGVE